MEQKEERKITKVKTVYASVYRREPDISEYTDKKDAENFVEECRKWGIGIVSCDIIE